MRTKYLKMTIGLGIMVIGMAACALSEPETEPSVDAPNFNACPRSPNCVSSKSPRGNQFVRPFTYSAAAHEAYQALVDILSVEKQARIIVMDKDYIHAEFVSKYLHFVDDVEFSFEPDQPVVHIRSASRSGYYDFGVNRRRTERLRHLFATALKP